MESEFRLVEALLEAKKEEYFRGIRFLCGKVGEREVVLMHSGIGKVCAAAGTVELIDRYAPECVLNTGVAGGIDASLQVMDVVVGSEVVYHDVWCGDGNEWGQVQGMPPRFAADSRLLQLALAVEGDVQVRSGLICSGDQFITARTELDAIKGRFPEGLAVDMESGAIAQTCYMCGVAFVSMRIISDTPGIEEHWKQYTNFWEAAPEQSFTILRRTIENL